MSGPEGRSGSHKEPKITRSAAAAAAAAKQTLKGFESDNNISRFKHLETTVKALQHQGSALTDEINKLKGLIKGLTLQIKALSPSNQDPKDGSESSKPPSDNNFAPTETAPPDLQGVIQKGLTGELTKKALSFPESARL